MLKTFSDPRADVPQICLTAEASLPSLTVSLNDDDGITSQGRNADPERRWLRVEEQMLVKFVELRINTV